MSTKFRNVHLLWFFAFLLFFLWQPMTGVTETGEASNSTEGLVILTPLKEQVLYQDHIRITVLAEIGATLQLAFSHALLTPPGLFPARRGERAERG